MKIECILEKINSPISIVSKLSSRVNSIPGLQGILLDASDGFLNITSTNLDMGIIYKVPVKVEQEGTVLVVSDIFTKAINAINESEKNITIELKDGLLVLKTKNNTITIPTLQKEDFPLIPKVEGVTIEIQKQVLIDGIKSVAFSCAHTDIKPEIASVYLYTEPGQMVFVATDSFRLAEKKIKIKSNTELEILIPSKNIQELLRVIEIMEDVVSLTYSQTMLSIKTENIYLTSRIIDGVFPDYKRIIPSEATIEAQVLKQDITQALKLITIFSDTFNQTSLKIDLENNQIHCVSNNKDLGSVEQKIQAKITGSDLDMNFNHRYLQEVLPIIQKESINLSFTTNNKPLVLKQLQDDSFLYLVMPLNR